MAHEQAPAVTWTSDAGTGPGNVPATLLASHWSQRCFPGS